ncbi:MAG: HypC/HybG/HupF family hydrogenase formation chaperone [Candidatus Brocadiales bacterium]
MCLGIPGKVIKIEDNALGMRMGVVDFGGTKREVCLAYLDDVKEGDWVIVHIGFAISKIDEAKAKDAFETLKEMGL